MIYSDRIQRLQNMMEERYDAALITPGTNFFYLSGLSPAATLERLFLLVVPESGEPQILAPMLYKAELEDSWIEDKIFWEDSENPYEKLMNIFKEIPFNKGVLLIENTMPSIFLLNIEKRLSNYKFETLGDIIKELRIRKDDEEISYLKQAAKIVDDVFYSLIEDGLKGKNEKEIGRKIEELIYEFGGDGISFSPIVASGPNGANPHHTPGKRIIKEGDLVILDYGAKYNGYCSDITRTVAVGKISEEALRVYEIVKEAQENAFNNSKVGVRAKDIDSGAREVISSYGYGKYFTHRTGHGLGLDVHEPPFITPTNDELIQNGMIFTIEPGIYLPGKFGVRIEDDIAIIEGGGIRLTNADRKLISL